MLFLITATFFASYLVRIYAWRSILGENGLLNSGLNRLGVIDEPLGFLLYNRFSVTVALVHIFLPYVVLVLYAGFRPVSPALVEAAQDLGANAPTRWRRVILPLVAAPAATAFMLRLRAVGRRLRDAAVPRRHDGAMLGVRIQAALTGDRQLAARRGALVPDALARSCSATRLTLLVLRSLRLDRIRFVEREHRAQRSPVTFAVTLAALVFLTSRW